MSEQQTAEQVVTKKKLSAREAERARDLADALDEAFMWDRTPQGHDYWKEVFNHLMSIAGSGERE
jgi:hypothetical protein